MLEGRDELNSEKYPSEILSQREVAGESFIDQIVVEEQRMEELEVEAGMRTV